MYCRGLLSCCFAVDTDYGLGRSLLTKGQKCQMFKTQTEPHDEANSLNKPKADMEFLFFVYASSDEYKIMCDTLLFLDLKLQISKLSESIWSFKRLLYSYYIFLDFDPKVLSINIRKSQDYSWVETQVNSAIGQLNVNFNSSTIIL